MSNTYEFRPAKRSEAKPLIGIYSESNGGKTYSSLLLARGFVGPKGLIGMVETEGGRGEAYADPSEYPEFAGPDPTSNYLVLPLRGDYSPAAYGKAFTAAEKAKLDALIIDSASHEWEADGGVLAMAAANQEAGKKGPIVWQKPKLEHQRHFMLRIAQTPIPLVILCMRAKYPMTEKEKPGGGKEWVRSETLEPKQADDILSEMFVHGWISPDHIFHLNRATSKTLAPVFEKGKPISLDTGRRMAEWAAQRAAAITAGATSDGAEKRDTLLADARDKAASGFDNLKRHIASLSDADRTALKPHQADLIKAAKGADQKLAEELGA